MADFTEISQKDLESLRNRPATLFLDVREVWEFADFNIGGQNIPPHEITEKLDELSNYETIIVACSNGTRSSIVARLLAKKLPAKEILHLEEGIY
ncbi:rhodanese-like domain-containing protein [Emticicia sp. TH156]|uniref:rhodanese-like domain-containing protein n=1 Tax=Emticicia sp. TH156 TaxID=2067454 RepID=UPI000C769DF7|nr:rhodanese-like domain-containing protein [Emticicia sp. TH156]PLK45539.1 sulfurtransferase [Emticicia sp. TH156]